MAGGRECGIPDQIRGAVVQLAPSSSLTRTLEPGHEVQRENAAICGFRRPLFAGFRVQTRANPPVEGHAINPRTAQQPWVALGEALREAAAWNRRCAGCRAGWSVLTLPDVAVPAVYFCNPTAPRAPPFCLVPGERGLLAVSNR